MNVARDRIRPALELASMPPQAHRALLRRQLAEVRQRTLSLVARAECIDPALFYCAVHRDFSPIGWHLGHIAAFAGIWILQRLAGQPPLSPAFETLFMPATNPKAKRGQLPPRDEVMSYLAETSRQVDRVLETTRFDAAVPLEREGVLFWNIVQHEHQHDETIAVDLHLYRPAEATLAGVTPWEGGDSTAAVPVQLRVPGGVLEQGTNAWWVYDNERPAHRVEVRAFRIDAHPVTNDQFAAFMRDGGYSRRELWSEEGWAFCLEAALRAPGSWSRHPEGGWHTWHLAAPAGLQSDAPVSGVSWYEAEAFARWRGASLPTEAEWEWAASVDEEGQRTFPWGERADCVEIANCELQFSGPLPITRKTVRRTALGLFDVGGNVWEWVDDWFAPYQGFRAFPYEEYSSPWFGDHKVLRGGAWTTHPFMMRTTFRNWYVPTCRAIVSGIRCVSHDV